MLFENSPEEAERYPYMHQYTSPMKKMARPLVGRENEKQLVKAAMLKPELCNVLLLGEAGSGKGCPLDTVIPVADNRGYIPIGDIKAGDYVFDENGNPAQVIGVYPQGLKRRYDVYFADGSVVPCNDEHIWNVRTRHHHYQGHPYESHTLRELLDYGITRTGHRSSSRPDQEMKCWYVPRNKAVERPERDFPVHPYVIGVFLGDGCMTDRPLSVASNDEPVVRRVAELIGAADAEKSPHNYTWHFTSQGPNKFIQMHEMAALLPDAKVFGYKSLEKRIPEEYFLGSVAQRMELLHGLMDTDGCTNGSDGRVNANFSTNNLGLAKDVQKLAASLGYRTSFGQSERNGDTHKNTEYRVYFMVPDEDASDLFWLQRHKDKIASAIRDDKKINRIYDDLAISKVIDTGREEEMVCIYVDSPSHLFQVGESHIVTHNTALVQGLMNEDTEKTYLEVDLPKMLANLRNENEMADRLKSLFAETSKFRNERGRDIVLFIDEFHQIVQLSAAAVEVLKPMLADSGTRGIRFIAATTQIEYQQFIAPNLPLVERLQRVRLVQPGEEVVVSILKSMCERYGVTPYKETLFNDIYTYTNRYIPATSQPRKSILILDTMIGWHRLTKRPLDRHLLADVIYETEGINVAFRVDPTSIKKRLDQKVLAQQVATTSIEQRLQICVAGLNNPNRPMSSFLFTGSTGVGKPINNDTPTPVYTDDGSVSWKRHGDLVVGDTVFGRDGVPTEVEAVFPKGMLDVYEFELTDGRVIECGAEHRWMYKSRFGNGSKRWKVGTTEELMEKMSHKYYNKGRSVANIKFVIPMNQPVQWPERSFQIDPYVIGAFLGNGCLCAGMLSFSSQDEEVVAKVAGLIGAGGYKRDSSSYTWRFEYAEDEIVYRKGAKGENGVGRLKCFQTDRFFESVPDMIGKHSPERCIPGDYMHGSVEQRWRLVQGLFDTDGHISNDDRFNVSFATGSCDLAYGVQKLLYSLGISSSVSNHGTRANWPWSKSDEYDVHVKIGNVDKHKFFSLERKLALARKAAEFDANKTRIKKFGDVIGIRDIRKTNRKAEMTCIQVSNDEHLYQVGEFVCSHNTEATKQLAQILYDDDRNLIRFDMTEFALENSLDRFRRELTNKVSAIPYCLILLDEIEKACAPVTRVLLQVLDDGRLMDENEREVTFKNAYIIVTTNAGNEIYKTISNYESSDVASFKTLDKYDKLIRESIKSQSGSKFPPELLGRIDCIVPFQPLSRKTMMGIIQMKLRALAETVRAKHGVTLRVHKNIYIYMTYDKLDSDSDSGGARIVVSKLERELTVPLSRYINEHPLEKEVFVSVGGQMAILNKQMLESEAYVYVGPRFVNENVDMSTAVPGIGQQPDTLS